MYLLLWAWLYIGIHSPVLSFLVSHGITGTSFCNRPANTSCRPLALWLCHVDRSSPAMR